MHAADLKAPLPAFSLGVGSLRAGAGPAATSAGRGGQRALRRRAPAAGAPGGHHAREPGRLGRPARCRPPSSARASTVVRSERGGAATLHAPGQLVSYPVLALPRRDLRAYVTALEEVLIRLVARYGVTASRSASGRRPGLYVGDRKIASIGLRCERWVASHGTALNVAVDLDALRPHRLVRRGRPPADEPARSDRIGARDGRDRARLRAGVRGGLRTSGGDPSPSQLAGGRASPGSGSRRLGYRGDEQRGARGADSAADHSRRGGPHVAGENPWWARAAGAASVSVAGLYVGHAFPSICRLHNCLVPKEQVSACRIGHFGQSKHGAFLPVEGAA